MTLLPVATSREAASLAWSLLAGRRRALAACLSVFVVEGLAGLVARGCWAGSSTSSTAAETPPT